MPRIQPYETQVQGAEPVGQLTPNTELAGAPGRALSQLGESIKQVGEVQRKQLSQDQTADAYDAYAKGSANFTNLIDQGRATGDLDEQAIRDQLKDYISSNDSNYTTPQARDSWRIKSARLEKEVEIKLGSTSAIIKGQKTLQKTNEGFANAGAAVEQDPLQFGSITESTLETLREQADNADPSVQKIMKSMLPAYEKQVKEELGFRAVTGLAKMNPDNALKMLKSGQFANVFDSKAEEKALGIVETWRRANDVQAKSAQAAQDDAQAEQASAWKQNALGAIVSGKMTAAQIVKSPLPDEEKMRWINFMEAQTDRQQKTDPRKFNDLYRRMHLPDDDPNKISDESQIIPYVGKGISGQGAQELGGFLKKTPEGERLIQFRKRANDMAQKAIAGKLMNGLPDLDGQANLMQFSKDASELEKAAVQAGKPAWSVYDPSDKDSIINKIPQYQTTPQRKIEQMQQQTFAAAHAATPPPAPAPVASIPGQKIQTPPVKDRMGPNGKRMIRPGESPADYLKEVHGL